MRTAAANIALTVALFCLAAGSALAQEALRHHHGVPEIDGPAGVSALALLIGAGLFLYNRYRK